MYGGDDVSIADELRADIAAGQERMKRARCLMCRWYDELTDDERTEFDVILPDRSFTDRSIAAWIARHNAVKIGSESVKTHRRNHLDDS